MSGTRTRLDQAMDRRRLDLRKQWKDIATAAGISTAALGAIRRGEYKPSALTARGIEDALQWAHGSIEAIDAGGDPVPLRGESPAAGSDAATETVVVAPGVDPDEARIWAIPGLSTGERWLLIAHARAMKEAKREERGSA